MPVADHALYALAWFSFGIGHSLLAGATRHRGTLKRFGGAHRLMYNGVAALHLALVLGFGWWLLHLLPPFHLPQAVYWAQNVMIVMGAGIGLAALRGYRAGPFLGFSQLRGKGDDDEPLSVTGIHRLIRHPLYTASMLILWGLARSQFGVATAIWTTLYFIIGSRVEEARLTVRYGDAYRTYRRTTPAFIPSLGRNR